MENAYLLLGPENGEKQKKLQQIRKELKNGIGSEPELYRFYPFETTASQIYSALDNNSFFSDHRLVIVSQAESLTAPQIDMLVSYLAHPAPNSTLVLISEDTSLKSAKLSKSFKKEAVTIFWEMFDNQKEDWIRNYFRQQGLVITSDGIETVLEMVDNNTVEIKSACGQLALFWRLEKKEGPVDEQAVETYMHHTRTENAFTLFPSIVSRDLKLALQILHSYLEMGDSGASIVLHAGLLWQFRRLESVSRLIGEGNNETGAFMGATVIDVQKPLRSRRDQNLYRSALKNYTREEIRSILLLLEENDITLKGAGDMSMLLWERLLYQIIVDKGKRQPEPRFIMA